MKLILLLRLLLASWYGYYFNRKSLPINIDKNKVVSLRYFHLKFFNIIFSVFALLLACHTNTVAQCTLSLKAKVSGCYQSGGNSKATVTVEVAWANAPASQNIVVTGPAGSVPATRTITPGTITVQYNDAKNTFVNSTQTIVSPQLVAFEIAADGSTGKTVTAAFSGTPSCNATSNTFNAPAACQPVACASGQIGGTVFFDFNADGTKQNDEIETGVSGVSVKVTDKNGATYTTTSVKYGRWRLSVPSNAYPVRVEFSSLPSYAGQGTQNGQDGNTTVQFIGAPDCNVDLGILDNLSYTNQKPDIFAPCYVNGDPLSGGGAAGLDALVKFDYDASGAKDLTKITPLATAAEVGSLWGLAYNKYKKTLFAAATVKRHVGLGPKGLGGIYVVNPTTAAILTSWNVTTDMGVNVGTIGNNTSRDLPAGTTTGSEDLEGFTKLGKVGIGDIDLSEPGNYLFFTNLFDKKLYRIDLTAYNTSGTKPTSANITSYTMPSPACASGELRPFGVKWYKNEVFVGAICDASTSKKKSDLRAYVFKLNLSTNTWATIFDFPLTYPKGFPTADKRDATGWYPWTDNFNDFIVTASSSGRKDITYPQPMLTDIEIDADGSMVLGFGDRGGMQTGYRNRATNDDGTQYTGYVGGDILRAFDNGSGSYVLENASKAGPNMGYAATNNQGPGFGEYYNDDWYNGDGTPKLRHSECVIGGLAMKPGSGEVIVGIVDPVDGINWSGGVRHYNNYTGLTENAFVLYRTTDGDGATQGKAAGLGDIELAIDVPTFIEVGNRIWLDNNGDGIQDPTEPGIDGVTVTLCTSSGTTIATAVTANGGQYYFSNATGTSTGNTKYGLNLQPNTTYKLKIPAIFNNNDLTDPNQGGDNIDSDFIVSGTKAELTITTGNAAINNHTFDAGYVPTPVFPKTGWEFTCADGVRVETKGTGNAIAAGSCNNSTAADVTLTLNFSNTSAIDSIIVEAIYKNDNPGPSVTFKDAANVSYVATRFLIQGLGDAWVYRAKVPATSSVKLTETSKPCNLQSMVAYAFRQEAGYASVGEFTCIQGYKNVKALTLDLPTRTKVSDMTVCLPVSELTTDGRPLTIKATAGSVTTQTTITGPDGSLNTCCLNIVKLNLANVPTTATTVTVEITSPTTPEGQSYTIAGAVHVNVLCEKCIKPTAGPDVAICAPATGVNLPDAASGQSWVVGTKPTGTTPTINSTTGVVAGMTANGIYQFILRTTTDATCADTVIVTRKPKPNAGSDQSICAPTATASLGAAPSGASWSVQAGNPAAATVGSATGNVSGMTANGTYNFILTQNGCTDTVSVTRNAKPNAGTDKKICAPATTASLGAAPSGGAWSAQSGNPAAATVGASTGAVSGMTANGNYKFILTVNGCTDTVMVTRNPAPTIAATPTCNPGLLTYNISVTTTNATGLTATAGTVTGTAPNFTVSNVTVGVNVTLTANNTSTTCSATQVVNSPNCTCPALAPTASNVSRCGPGQVTMTAVGTSTCNTLRWYANSTGGSILATGASFTRTVADDSTFYVACYNTASACESPRKAVNINIIPKPNAGPNQSICEPATTANLADAQSGQQWVAQAGNPAAATINATTGAISGMTANGLYYFILRSTASNTCADTVIVDRNPKPNAGPDQSICAPTTSIDLPNAPSGGAWSAQTGNPAAATITASTGIVSGMSVDGTYRFILTVDGCKDTVAVTRNNKPNAGTDQTICTPATTTSLGAAPVGASWAAQSGNPAAATVNSSTGVVAGMTADGTYKFILTEDGCKDTVMVIRNPKPNAGTDQSVCAPTTTASLGAAPSGGSWAVRAGNPAAATVNTSTGAVAGMTANGTYRFVLTLNGCTDTVAIVRNAKPNAGADKKICAPTASVALGAAPAGGTWAAQTGNPVATTVNASTGAISGMTANGTYKFILTVNGCTDTVAVVRNPVPTISATPICNPGLTTYNVTVTTTNATSITSTAGTVSGTAPNFTVSNVPIANNITITANNTSTGCSASSNVTAPNCSCPAVPPTAADVSRCGPGQITLTAVGNTSCNTIRWYQAASGGTPLTTGTSFTTTIDEDSTFYVACYNTAQDCESSRKAVMVTIIAKPNAGTDAEIDICAPQTTYDLPNAQTGQEWVVQAGNPAAATINTSTGAVAGMTANGTYKFILRTIGQTSCADTAIIVRNAKPNAGQDQKICAPATSIKLSTAPTGGSWTAQTGNPAAASINTSTGQVNGLTANGTYRFILTIGDCKDTVAVVRYAKPNAGADETICEPTTTANLTDAPAGSSWAAMANNPAAATINATTGVIAGMTANGTYRFILTNTTSGCTDTVAVIRNPKPDAGDDLSICAPTTTASLGTAPAGASWSVQAGNPAAVTVNASTGAVTGMTINGTYSFILTLNGCTDTVQVTRNIKPNAGTDKKICAPATTAALGAAPAGTSWAIVAGNPAAATVNASTGAVAGMTANGSYKFALNSTAGCTDTVIVTRNPRPTISAVPTCDPGLLTYDLAVTTVNATSLTSTAGTVSGTAPNFTVSNIPVGTNVTLTASSTTTTCSTTFDITAPNCSCPAVPPTVADVNRCGPGQVTMTAVGNASCNTIRWYAASTGGTPLATGTSFSPTVSDDSTFYVACYNTAQACESSRKGVMVTIVAKPSAGSDVALNVCNPLTTTDLPDAQAGQEWVVMVGNPAAATVNASTGAVAGMTANGTYKFIIRTISDPTCSDTTTVIRQPKPNAGQDATICAPATSYKLAAAPTNGSWSALATNPAAATIALNGQITGMIANGTYRFVLASAAGCTDTVAVRRNPKPNAGADVSICEPETITNLPDAPAGGAWTAQAGNPTTTTINATTGAVTGMTANGTYKFILTLNGCTDTVSVVRNPRPNAGPDMMVCGINTANLPDAPAGGAWSALPDNPVAATINATTGVVSGMTANGTYTFVLTAAGCTDTVEVTRNPKPNGGINRTICEPIATFDLPNALSGQEWKSMAGNPAAATITASTGVVTGMTANGTYRFLLQTIADPTCQDTVSITRTPKPNAGPDVAICQPETAADLTDAPVGGSWAAQAGNPVAATINAATGAITGMTANGTYRFILTVSGCKDTVAVIRNAKPNAGVNVRICAPATTADLRDAPAGGKWSVQTGNPAAATITDSTGMVAGMTANGTYRFILTLNGCTDTVSVIRSALPTITTTAICNTDGLTYNIMVRTTGANSLESSVGTVTGTAPNFVVNNIPKDSLTVTLTASHTTTKCSTVKVVSAPNCAKGSLGDYVWKDANDNGRQDDNETGIEGVVVQLFKNGSTTAFATDTTDADGQYGFANLDSASYQVKIVLSSLPTECQLSSKANQAGVPDSLDSDFTASGTTANSPVVVIDPKKGGLDQNNPTIDAGLVFICVIPTITVTDPPVCATDNSTYTVKFTVSAGKVSVDKGILTGSGVGPYTLVVSAGQNVTIKDSAGINCIKTLVIDAPNCGCPTPQPTIIANNLSICEGEPLPKIVATVSAGATVDWYDAPTGGNKIATGTLEYQPTKAGMYYAEARNLTIGCTSLVRTKARVIITTPKCVPLTVTRKKTTK